MRISINVVTKGNAKMDGKTLVNGLMSVLMATNRVGEIKSMKFRESESVVVDLESAEQGVLFDEPEEPEPVAESGRGRGGGGKNGKRD